MPIYYVKTERKQEILRFCTYLMHTSGCTYTTIACIWNDVYCSSGVTNLFETKSYFLVQIHVKGYQFDTHTSKIKICSICLQLCYHS